MNSEVLVSWKTYIESRIKLDPDPRLYEELGRTVMLLTQGGEDELKQP